MQAIYPQTDAGDKKQAVYNLFAAYIHTVPFEQLIESVERARREVTRNQEQDPHKVGLVDERKKEQHGERQRIVVGWLQVIEGRERPIDYGQMMEHHQRDYPGPQVVGEIDAIGQFSWRKRCFCRLRPRALERFVQIVEIYF